MAELDRWIAVLPSVFDLLLHNADGIVDDTSLEKLLAWLSEVCCDTNGLKTLLREDTSKADTSTRGFLQSEKLFESPGSLAFAHRLCGIFWSREETFKELKSLVNLFKVCRDDSALWHNPVVRNSYFVGLQSLTEHGEGMDWLSEHDEYMSTAVNHIIDNSMFVATAARTLVAKFLITSYQVANEQTAHSNTRTLDSQLFQSKIRSLLEKLHENLCLEPDSSITKQQMSDSRIAVLDVLRILLNTDPQVGEEILNVSGLFSSSVELMKTCDEIVCTKFVDVVSEMVQSTSLWNLHWEKLLVHTNATPREQVMVSPAIILLEVPLVLIQRGLLSNAFNLIAGLAFSNGSIPRCFPLSWYGSLYCFIDSTIVALHKTKQRTTENYYNGEANNQSKNMIELATDLLSIEERDLERTKIVQENFTQQIQIWLTDKKSCVDVLIKVLSTIEDLVKKALVSCLTKVPSWAELTVNVLRNCAVEVATEQDEFPFDVLGNNKILKTSLRTIHSLLKVQMEVQDLPFAAIKVFHEAVQVLVALIKNSQTETTVITSALQTLGSLLQLRSSLTDKLLIENIQSQDAEFSSPSKKPRLSEPSTVLQTERKQGASVVGGSFTESLGFTLHRRLRDQRWEVKDSILEFITCLLHIPGEAIVTFFVEHNVPSVVWQAVDDCESYVRTSAWQTIGQLVRNPRLLAELIEKTLIREIDILSKIVDVIEDDSEAFPRRRVVECLTLWTHDKLPMLSAILPPTPGKVLMTTEGSCNAGDVTTLISRAVTCALKDFDWEVKLRALEFLERVIRNFVTDETSSESKNGVTASSSWNNETHEDILKSNDVKSTKISTPSCSNLASKGPVTVLFELRVLRPLLESVSDCDHLVCEKALAVIAFLKYRDPSKESKLEKTTYDGAATEKADGTPWMYNKNSVNMNKVEGGKDHVERNESNVHNKKTETVKRVIILKDESTLIKTAEDLQAALGAGDVLSVEIFVDILRRIHVPCLKDESAAANMTIRSDPVCLLEDILSAAGDHDDNLLDCY